MALLSPQQCPLSLSSAPRPAPVLANRPVRCATRQHKQGIMDPHTDMHASVCMLAYIGAAGGEEEAGQALGGSLPCDPSPSTTSRLALT
eukprot:1155397-Pelagomonas_calceolata.AAC.11